METKTAGEHTQGAVNLYDKILNSCTDKWIGRFELPLTNGAFAISTNKMIMCKMPFAYKKGVSRSTFYEI